MTEKLIIEEKKYPYLQQFFICIGIILCLVSTIFVVDGWIILENTGSVIDYMKNIAFFLVTCGFGLLCISIYPTFKEQWGESERLRIRKGYEK